MTLMNSLSQTVKIMVMEAYHKQYNNIKRVQDNIIAVDFISSQLQSYKSYQILVHQIAFKIILPLTRMSKTFKFMTWIMNHFRDSKDNKSLVDKLKLVVILNQVMKRNLMKNKLKLSRMSKILTSLNLLDQLKPIKQHSVRFLNNP